VLSHEILKIIPFHYLYKQVEVNYFMPTKELSKGMLKALEDIKDTAKTFGGDSTIKVKATKKKTLKAVFPISGELHFNLYINDKIFGSYLFNGKEWRKG
jgi:hypothetical protein